MWSAGCIFFELLTTGHPLFCDEGLAELGIVFAIFKTLGYPNNETWPDCENLANYKNTRKRCEDMMEQQRRKEGGPRGIKTALTMKGVKDVPDDMLDLLERMVTINPDKRISALEALEHPYFSNEPQACAPEDLPKFEGEISQVKTEKQA